MGDCMVRAYNKKRALNDHTSNIFQAASTDGSTLTYELTDLIDGQDYFVRVRAENMAGISMGFTELDEPVCAKEPVSKYIVIVLISIHQIYKLLPTNVLDFFECVQTYSLIFSSNQRKSQVSKYGLFVVEIGVDS